MLERFAATLNTAETETTRHVSEFLQWRAEQHSPETELSVDDDVDLRSYLMQLRVRGTDPSLLRSKTTALKRFYSWAQAEGVIPSSPFDEFNFDRPFLDHDQIRRRQSALDVEPKERELLHLRALNRLAEQLNQAVDVQSALDKTMTALVEVMSLSTAWAFVSADSGLLKLDGRNTPPHDFVLAAACGLPPGLEHDQRYYLRCPPDCHCQKLLRSGHLVRAVNVVECTRLLQSVEAGGDSQDLLFHASMPIIAHDRVLGIINVATKEWQFLTAADLTFLSAVGAYVAAVLERALLYDQVNQQRIRLERELDMARAVQASLLPERLPAIPGFSLAADWRSAHEVAGDFYDIFELPGHRWGILIGDVSDKGAHAALYMVTVCSLVRFAAAHALSPARVLRKVDQSLRRFSTTSMFVTVFYAVLDPAKSELKYANAGHNPPLVQRSTGQIQPLTRTGPALGVFEHLRLAEKTLLLEPGETVVVYTDGLTEAFNADNEQYGIDRLVTRITNFTGAPADLLQGLLSDLSVFTSAAPPSDDLTLFILRRN